MIVHLLVNYSYLITLKVLVRAPLLDYKVPSILENIDLNDHLYVKKIRVQYLVMFYKVMSVRIQKYFALTMFPCESFILYETASVVYTDYDIHN